MNALLWTLVMMGASNLICLMFSLFISGSLPPSSNFSRFLDSLITTALMIWAVVLLFGRGVFNG